MKLLLALAAALALLLAAGAAEPTPQPPTRFTLEAEQGDFDLTNELAQARGHALLCYQDLQLRADTLEANLHTGQLQAAGGVTLLQGARRLTAERADYNIRTGSGTLTRATASVGPALFRGELLAVTPRRITIQHASFTTCALPHPDYEVRARTISYYPGDRVVARHAAIYLYGHRLLTLPSISQSVQEDREAPGLEPKVGYSRLDGPYAGLSYGFEPAGRDTTGVIDLRYTSRRGSRGWLRTSYLPSWGRITLVASRREDLNERPITSIVEPLPTTVRQVTVDRLPELAVQRKSTPLLPWLDGRFWLTAGRYHEVETDVWGNRLSLVGDVETEHLQLGRRTSLTLGYGVRQSYYAHERQRVSVPRISAYYDAGPGFTLNLAYQHRSHVGDTPFTFDTVEIRRELTANLVARPHRLWRVEAASRYDTAAGELRDLSLTLVRTVHCLEYYVGWRKQGGGLRLGMSLAAGTLEALRAEQQKGW